MTQNSKFVSQLTTEEMSQEAHTLLHQCWGQAQESVKYDKSKWSRFSEIVEHYRNQQKSLNGLLTWRPRARKEP